MSSSPSRQHYQRTCCCSLYLFMSLYMWSLMFLAFYTLLCQRLSTWNRTLDRPLQDYRKCQFFNIILVYDLLNECSCVCCGHPPGIKVNNTQFMLSLNEQFSRQIAEPLERKAHFPSRSYFACKWKAVLGCVHVPVSVFLCGDPPCPSGSVVLWWARRLLCQRSCPAGTRRWGGAPTLASHPPWLASSQHDHTTGTGE